MGWILRMTVPAADSEAVTSQLWDLHPTGIAELGAGPAAGSDVTVELLAGFDTEHEARAAALAVGRGVGGPAGAAITVEPVDDRAWVDPDRRVDLEVAGHALSLEIGAAFGDGGHASTRLALDLLGTVVTPGVAVLDVGTGTGILALGARALGAGPVVAVDNDPTALAVAGRNLGDHPILGRDVTLTPSVPDHGSFPVVVANVVLGGQRDLAAGIGARVAPGGTLILAGLLTTQEDEVRRLHPGLVPDLRRVEGDWLALGLRSPSPAATGPRPGPAP